MEFNEELLSVLRYLYLCMFLFLSEDKDLLKIKKNAPEVLQNTLGYYTNHLLLILQMFLQFPHSYRSLCADRPVVLLYVKFCSVLYSILTVISFLYITFCTYNDWPLTVNEIFPLLLKAKLTTGGAAAHLELWMFPKSSHTCCDFATSSKMSVKSNSSCMNSLYVDCDLHLFFFCFWNLHSNFVSSGRDFPPCPEGSEVSKCTASMDAVAFNTYTEFFTHTQSICHFLQSEAWQNRAENTMYRWDSCNIHAGNMLLQVT